MTDAGTEPSVPNPGGVNVSIPFGTLADGRPEAVMNCAIAGTPDEPTTLYMGPTDV